MRNCSPKVSAILLGLAIVGMAMAGSGGDNMRVETRVVERTIAPGEHFEFSRSVGPGRIRRIQDGVPGSVRRTYRVRFSGSRVVSRELLKEEQTAPRPTIYHMGRGGFTPSRGAFSRRRTLTMEATAYDPSPRTIGPGATGRTKNGMIARFGVVAVDPKVIPLGTLLFVEGYGFAIAADIGGGIRGKEIDLCFNERSTALAFGRRMVRVHVFGRP